MDWTRIFIDLDGTICGETQWDGFVSNSLSLFKGLKWVPPKNIEWSILTSRPKIDRWLVNAVCWKYNLIPTEIILCDTWLYNFKSTREVALWKHQVIQNVLSRTMTNNVIYVDSDPEILQNIPSLTGLQLCNTKAASNLFDNIRRNDGATC